MRGLVSLLAVGIVLCIALSFAPMSRAAPADVIWMQTTSSYMECNADESVVYEWFIFNGQMDPELVEITVNVSSGEGWSSDLDRTVAVLHPQESLFVNLTFSAKTDVGSHNISQSIFFEYTNLNNTDLTFIDIAEVHTQTVPVWGIISPGKNKLLGTFDNPLPAPLDNNYVTFGLNIGVWGVVAVFFTYIINPLVHMFTKRTKTDIDDRILKILHRPIFLLIVLYGVVSSFTILPLSEGSVRFISEAYGILLIAIVTFVGYKIFKEVLIYIGRRVASRTKTEIDDVLIPVVDKVGGLVILVFGGMAVISYLGYNITFLLAGVGVFGLVIAFAAQDALSNFFSGMALLLDRPFAEGDFVLLSTGETCRIEKIGVRSCRLYDVYENTSIVLPNNKLVNDKVTNLSEPDAQGVAEVAVSVAIGSDVKKVERILIEVATAHKEVLKDAGKEPVVRFSEFAESSLRFKLYVWVEDFMSKLRVAHELRKEIYDRFSKEHIELSVPQRAVLIKERSGKD
jgi:MscS family membrane protein